MFLKRTKLLDSCTFALALTFEQIPSHPFASLIAPSASRSHSSHVFSFRHFFPPLPPSFLFLFSKAPLNSPLFSFPFFMTPFFQITPPLLSPLRFKVSALILLLPLQPFLKVGYASISVLDDRIVIYCDHSPISCCQHDLNQSG